MPQALIKIAGPQFEYLRPIAMGLEVYYMLEFMQQMSPQELAMMYAAYSFVTSRRFDLLDPLKDFKLPGAVM